jgi:hypothetical protein
MERAETTMTGRAVPDNEAVLLWYCLASMVWLSAAIVAVVGLAKRRWARLGRNATWIFLAHMLVAVVASIACVVINQGRRSDMPPLEEALPLVVAACVIASANFLAAAAFAWAWAGRRRDRIERDGARRPDQDHAYRGPGWPPQSSGEYPPGLWRFALYAGSLLFWPAGVVAVIVLSKPKSAGIGASAFRCSLIHMMAIVMAVCGAIPVGLALM